MNSKLTTAMITALRRIAEQPDREIYYNRIVGMAGMGEPISRSTFDALYKRGYVRSEPHNWWSLTDAGCEALNSVAPAPKPTPAPATDNPDADVTDADVTDADFARWEAELVANNVHNTVIRLIDRATFCADMPGAPDEIKQQMATLIAALTAAKQVADTL